jgi:hypothetical protein
VLLTSVGGDYIRVGIEAGPLSQWLVNALTAADLPVICVETRHMKALLQAQQINKSDRNDARGIAQMMRVSLFKPVHVKTLAASFAGSDPRVSHPDHPCPGRTRQLCRGSNLVWDSETSTYLRSAAIMKARTKAASAVR